MESIIDIKTMKRVIDGSFFVYEAVNQTYNLSFNSYMIFRKQICYIINYIIYIYETIMEYYVKKHYLKYRQEHNSSFEI